MIATMDENRPPFSLKAPGSPGSSPSLRLPGRSVFPRVDDRLVEPEVTRDEIINGRRVVAFPADVPHATQHSELDYLLRAHAAPGYRTATDLLTRHAVSSDFASDACLYKEGADPATGGRCLEELAFEVISEQNQRKATEKAVLMHHRGVRRIFAIFVKTRRAGEWSAESRSWRLLAADTQIEDPCLVTPLPVAALLDAAEADNAVVEALAAKGNPAIRRREAAAEAKGKADAILQVLETRGVAVSGPQREELLRCRDLDRLDQWLRRAVLALSMDEVMEEPPGRLPLQNLISIRE